MHTASGFLPQVLAAILLVGTCPVPVWPHEDASADASMTHQCHTSDAEGQICPPVAQSVNLDLSSSTRNIHVGSDILSSAIQTAISAAGQSRTLSPGDLITPAEFVALNQVLSAGSQIIQLDTAGRASGGSFDLSSFQTGQLTGLVVPEAVVAIASQGGSSLNVSGNLITQGILVGLPTAANTTNTVSVIAGLINVGPGGSITTHISDALAAIIGSPLAGAPVNLFLQSQSNIVNAGNITASGVLNLQAAGSIINQLPAGSPAGLPLPVMAGDLGTRLIAGSGIITNSGTITSRLGNISFSTLPGHDLVLNNITGQIASILGRINFREDLFTSKENTSILGGSLSALEDVNVYGGEGLVSAHVDLLDAVLNVRAGEAHVSVREGDFRIGDFLITGDPTIANSGGNVLLNGNLVFAGQDLAILASGNVEVAAGASVSTIDLSSSGNAGDLTIVAGFNFTPSTSGQVTDSSTTFTLGSPSTSGGRIRLENVSLNTSSTGGNGGDVTIMAHDGSSVSLEEKPQIIVGSINASTSSSNPVHEAGDVEIFGQSGVQTGAITATGPIGGDVRVKAREPQIAGGSITFTNGTRGGVGVFQAGPLTSSFLASPTVAINGAINTSATSGAAGDVTVLALSNISIAGGVTATGGTSGGAGGDVLVSSDTSDNTVISGNVSISGNINSNAGGSTTTSPGGTAGNVTLNAQGYITAAGNMIAQGGDNSGGGNAGAGGTVNLTTSNNNPSLARVGAVTISGFVDLAGGDASGGGNGGEERGSGKLEVNLHRMRIDDFDACDERFEHGPAAGAAKVRVEHPGKRGLHVSGRERVAVMPRDPLSQKKGISFAIGGDLPSLGQVGDDLAGLLRVILEEAAVHTRHRLLHR